MNSDVSFEVYSDDQLLGALSISKGSIDWRPRRRRTKVSMTWERFAELMERDQ